MKRFFLILTILLFAGVTGAAVWYTSYNKELSSDSLWLSRRFNAARSVSVKGSDGAYLLTLTKQGWEAQVSGASGTVTARVLPEKLTQYLQELPQLSPSRSMGRLDHGGLEEYGLNSPDFTLIVSFSEASDDALTVKFTSDGGGTIYGWISDNPGLVYEFEQASFDLLNKPVTAFLDTRVFDIVQEKVTRVQLVQPFGSSWLVSKHKEGFFFDLPGYLAGKPASDSEMNLYIHSLELLKATSLSLKPIVTEEKIPSLTVRLWTEPTEDPATVEFFPIEDDPAMYVGKSTWLTVPFLLDAQSVGQLIKSAFDVQGRSVIKFDIGRVDRMLVNHGGTEYLVQKGESGWRVLGSKNDILGIDMSLWRFTELQFEALPINSLPESAVKLMYCKLVDSDGIKLTELTFYADPKLPKGQCWMKNGGEMFYPVSSRLLKDLQGMFPVQGTPLQ